MLLLAGTWLVRTLRRALGLVVGAMLLGVAAVGLFRSDGIDRLLGMVIGVGALGLGALGAVMLGTAARRRD